MNQIASGLNDLKRPNVPAAIVAYEYWIKPEKFAERCSKLGDRFLLSLPGMPPLVCITSPEDMRAVFAGDQTALHFGEGLTKFSPHELVVGPTSISVKDGEEHLKDRRMLAPHFSHASIRQYAPVFREKTRKAMQSWPENKPFSFYQAMMTLTLDIIIEVVFGVTDEKRADALRKATLELLRVVGGKQFFLSMIVAVSKGGVWDGKYKKLKRAKARVDSLVLEELNERRQANNLDREDLLSVFMKMQRENPQQMPDEAIFDAMRTLVVGGYETTASSMAWLGERIIRDQDVIRNLEKAADEGDEEYLEAVVSEGLRARPNLPHTVRYVVKPFDLGKGLSLDPGTMILPMMSLCHHRPDIYPNPEKFDPGRFVGKKASAYELINFGGGLRKCLGAPFALLEMKEIIRAIVEERHFEYTAAKGEKVKRSHVTLVPGKGAMVRLSKRNRNRSL